MAKYFLVEADQGGDCPQVLETFTDYQEAVARCDEMRQKGTGASVYHVTDRDTFEDKHLGGMLY